MVWRLEGTENQKRIIREALTRCDFPFEKLLPGLRKQTGRDYIPVEWADLSRWAAQIEEAKASGGHAHVHDEEWGTGHPVEREVNGRSRVLGLAWYSGKVSLEITMEGDPELAGEVFFSEGAHMIDFFYMEDIHRAYVWNAFHDAGEDIPSDTNIVDGVEIGHGHGWFDVGGYYAWVGEAFMGGFVKAYTDYDVTILFDHPVNDAVAQEIRQVLTPELMPTPKGPDVPPVEETPDAPDEDVVPAPYFVGKNKEIYHDSHKGIYIVEYFDSPPDFARACKVCKPDRGV